MLAAKLPLSRAPSRKLLFNIDEKNILDISYNKEINPNRLDRSINKNEIAKQIIMNNNGKSLDYLFRRFFWDIKIFNNKNLPIVVDKIRNKSSFDKKHQSKFFWLLDLPIKMPGIGWKVPSELSQFSEFISKSIGYEKMVNPNIDNYYAYLSVDQRVVAPNESQRRPGWHADSFITKYTNPDIEYNKQVETDSIYLAYNSLPTEFCAGPFTFNQSFDHHDNVQVLSHFDNMARGKEIITYSPYTILKMGPECVHRVGFNKSDHYCPRTFIKMVFSKQIFNRIGNDHNHLVDYNWPLVPRTKERNNSNIAIFRNDDNEYLTVAPEDLFKNFNGVSFIWSKNKIYSIYRTSKIIATPAREGELLQTELNGSIISYNTAKRGDWKVKKISNGTEYFLSSDQMEKFYDFDYDFRTTEIIFRPKKIVVQAIELDKPIKIIAPWKHTQYLSQGDFIVRRSDNDIYGVNKDNIVNDYYFI